MSTNKYMAEYMLARYKKRMQEYIEYLGGKCISCKSVDNLQIDHIDPKTKSFTIAANWNYKREIVYTELTKCQLLCQPCHNLKTLKDNNQVPAKATHGTLSSYRYCHCIICKKAKNDYMIEYRKIHPRKSRSKKSALVL